MERTNSRKEKVSKKRIIVVVIVSMIAIILAVGCFAVANNLKIALKSQEEAEIDETSFYWGIIAGRIEVAFIGARSAGEISDEENEKEIQLMEAFIKDPSNEAFRTYVEYVDSLSSLEGVAVVADTLGLLEAETEMQSIDQKSCEKGHLVMLYYGLSTMDYISGEISEQEFQAARRMYFDVIENPNYEKVDEYLNYMEDRYQIR